MPGDELLARLLATAPGTVERLGAVPEELVVPAAPTWFVGPRGAELGPMARRLEGVAYVEHLRVTASEVFVATGDPAVLDLACTTPPLEVLYVSPRGADAARDQLPSDLASDRFSLPAYRALLREATAAGYRWIGFDEALATAPERSILLRHDVDLSLTRAVRMAQLEAAEGASATYFVMVSGAFYDVLEPEHRRAVRAIAELGHTIGLHYDEEDDIEEGLAILSVVAGRPLRHIAQHNPTLLPRRSLDAELVVDAYDARLAASGFVYVSDSGMRWRARTFGDLVREAEPRIYALCHPESWTTEGQDLLGMVRTVEETERRRRRERYDRFVEGNVRYLRARKVKEGR